MLFHITMNLSYNNGKIHFHLRIQNTRTTKWSFVKHIYTRLLNEHTNIYKKYIYKLYIENIYTKYIKNSLSMPAPVPQNLMISHIHVNVKILFGAQKMQFGIPDGFSPHHRIELDV